MGLIREKVGDWGRVLNGKRMNIPVKEGQGCSFFFCDIGNSVGIPYITKALRARCTLAYKEDVGRSRLRSARRTKVCCLRDLAARVCEAHFVL